MRTIKALEPAMPFMKDLRRRPLIVVLATFSTILPGIAQDSSGTDAQSKANDLATRPVNEKILPLIKDGYNDISKGSYDKAVAVLKKAIEIDSDSISARRYLAYALIKKGAATEAIRQMQTVSKMIAPNAFDFYLFACAYFAAGGVKEAHDCYNEALRQSPGYDAARVGLVKTLAQEHNYADAMSAVQEGLQLTKTESVKKYYKALGKDVMEAQSFQQKDAVGTTNVPSASAKHEAIIIK